MRGTEYTWPSRHCFWLILIHNNTGLEMKSKVHYTGHSDLERQVCVIDSPRDNSDNSFTVMLIDSSSITQLS